MDRLKDKYNFIYVYDVADVGALEDFEKLGKVVKNVGQIIEGDLCIYSSIFQANHRIKARRYIQVVHTEFSKWNISYKHPREVNVHVAVGEGVQKDLKENFNIDSIVIPNPLNEPTEEKALRLLTASRIDNGKGFERVIKMARLLKESKKPFLWEIYGTGSRTFLTMLEDKLKDVPEVALLGERKNIQAYMRGVDYIVQLSDSEGFCYSIHEALQIEKPVIVTDWQGVREVVEDGNNGYVLDMDLTNLDINKLYNEIPKSAKLLKVNNFLQDWINLIS